MVRSGKKYNNPETNESPELEIMVTTKGHPSTLIIVGLMFLGVGWVAHFSAANEKARLAEVARWPKQPATIVSAEGGAL